jgi:hypothetical protein
VKRPNFLPVTLESIAKLYEHLEFDKETLSGITNAVNDPNTIPFLELGGHHGCYREAIVGLWATAIDNQAEIIASIYLKACPHTKCVMIYTRRPRLTVCDRRIIYVYCGANHCYSPQFTSDKAGRTSDFGQRYQRFMLSTCCTHCSGMGCFRCDNGWIRTAQQLEGK